MTISAPITVILPNYNHARFVGRALRAVLAQSVTPERILVIDDGSTDDSLYVIRSIACNAPTVTVLSNGANLGVERTIERALALCETAYFSAITAPDELLPGFFAAVLPWIERHPKAGLYLTDFCFRTGDSSELFPKHVRLRSDAGFLSPDQLVQALPRAGYILPAYGCVFRTEAIREAGGFRPELRWHADWFAELVVGFRNGICYVPQPLAVADMSPQNYSAGANRWASQRVVLQEILSLLDRREYADIAPAMHASRALAYFGLDILRAAYDLRRRRTSLLRLPVADIFAREIRKTVVRKISARARRRYWTIRYAVTRKCLASPKTSRRTSLLPLLKGTADEP